MSAEAAEAAKQAGNAAFKAGKFDEAIEKFTEAIEADATNHVLYSNRSGAHASKMAFTDALMDANKCIQLKADWPKGHSRRGAAYVGLRNWPSAQAAYEKALELDPASAHVQEELNKVKARRAENKQSANNPYAQYAQMGAAPPAASSSPVAVALSGLSLGCGFFYMLPLFPRLAFQAYRLCVANILGLFLVNLWGAFPKKLATLSDPAFHARQEVQAFMVCVLMLLSPPLPFGIMPFICVALLNVLPAVQGVASGVPLLGPKLVWLNSDEGKMSVHSFGSVCEVMVSFMSPLLIAVQGVRMAVLSFVYFQYVVRRKRTTYLCA